MRDIAVYFPSSLKFRLFSDCLLVSDESGLQQGRQERPHCCSHAKKAEVDRRSMEAAGRREKCGQWQCVWLGLVTGNAVGEECRHLPARAVSVCQAK